MKSQLLISLSTLLAVLTVVSSCNNDKAASAPEKESTLATAENAPKHTHVDTTSEEIEDQLVITSKQYKSAGIELGTLQDTELSETIRVTGSLDVPPQNYAQVSPYIGGVIKSINAVEGDYVKKGQTVMTLEHPDYVRLQEEYSTVKSNLSYLEKEYQRQKTLHEKNVGSGKAFQEAESNYNTEKGKLSSIMSQLSMVGISTSELDKGNVTNAIALRAPVSGYVANINGSLGSYAEPNKMLFDVVDNSSVYVHLDLFEKDVYKVALGQKVTVRLPNRGDGFVEAEVFKIGRAMNNANKSIPVHAKIKSAVGVDLMPGVFVTGVIYVDDHATKAVPLDAVVRAGERQYVFIVNDSLINLPPVHGKDPLSVKDAQGNVVPLAYEMVEVRTGAEENGLVEVEPMTEITTSNRIVVKGAYFLMSALKSGETVGCCAPAEGEPEEE